jgi:hypothetical protein
MGGSEPVALLTREVVVWPFTTERDYIDHACCERQTPQGIVDDLLYNEAARRAAPLDFLFFLEAEPDKLTWSQISAAVARYNRS